MGTAFVIGKDIGGYAGVANLYRMEPPFEGFEYVTVFAVDYPGTQHDETTLVGARPDGSAILMNRLPGSLVGWANHEKALSLAGYEVAVDSPPAPLEPNFPTVDPDEAA